jgi:hypothetical protein
MIVSVQFDLSQPKDAELFAIVSGRMQASKTVDAPAVYEVAKDSDLEFPLKKDLPSPSIAEVQVKFKKCQDKDAIAAKELMKGFLAHHGAKAVKDLDDDQRISLKADLDDFLNG